MKASLSPPALLLCSALFVTSCHSTGTAGGALLFDGIEGQHWAVRTNSTQAQQLFDQGWALYCGFNHEEAIRSFEGATRCDPDCAMAYFGIALSHGPNINNPVMDADASRAAYDAAQRAVHHTEGRSGFERELALALAQRYAIPAPEDRSALDRAWSDALREVWRRHRDTAEIGALFAESLLDLRPWDQWTPAGEPQPGTEEALAAIEGALTVAPRCALANHVCVHALEASPHPERALACADRLRKLVPGAGHLVHMPAHIDIRLGHYAEAAQANERAIEADIAYVARAGKGGFYTMYRAHNYQFLAYAEMFEGREHDALAAAREMLREVPLELVHELPQLTESYMGLSYHVLVRFGRWQEILREPAPAPELLATNADWHYARGIALAALGRVDEAAFEQIAFEGACAKVPAEYQHGTNSARAVLDVAREMLAGELEYRRGLHQSAFEHLRRAIEIDDGLHYDEPWGWMMPARHPLGALLLEQGRVEEAEQVYREDLARHPENGWALFGLEECLRRQGRTQEAAQTKKRFEGAWSRADTQLVASCFCRTGG